MTEKSFKKNEITSKEITSFFNKYLKLLSRILNLNNTQNSLRNFGESLERVGFDQVGFYAKYIAFFFIGRIDAGGINKAGNVF